jgi:hypothetical protein
MMGDNLAEDRKKLEKNLRELITKRLLQKYGPRCMICGKDYEINSKTGKCKHVGQFHILPKGGLYANLKYRPENIIQAGWWCCHYPFHHDHYKARDIVVPKLKKYIGDNFEQRLINLSQTLPKTTIFELKKLYEYWDIVFLKGNHYKNDFTN